MLIIKVKNGKLDPALKAYKRRVRQTKQLNRIRDKQHFVKKSTKKRLSKQKAIYKDSLRRKEEE